MSVTSVQDFFKDVAEDQELQTELAKALETENDRAAVTELAKEKGYSFSEDELWAEVQARQAEFQKRQEAGELTDEELEAVAGGATPAAAVVSLFAVTVGATVSGAAGAAKSATFTKAGQLFGAKW